MLSSKCKTAKARRRASSDLGKQDTIELNQVMPRKKKTSFSLLYIPNFLSFPISNDDPIHEYQYKG